MQPDRLPAAKRQVDLLCSMKDSSELIRAEIGDVKAIVKAACAMEEAHRGGGPVDPHEAAVQVRVADIILGGVGAYLRQMYGELAVTATEV